MCFTLKSDAVCGGIRYVTCACILHNLLIAEPIPNDWKDAANGNENELLEEDDELNASLANEAGGSERRNQLLCYLLEIRR